MVQCDPRNRSTYHSGQLKVTQRFSGGVQFLVSYTYGKALDYGGSAASGGGAVGNPQTVTDLEAGHGPSGLRRAPSRRDQRRMGTAVGARPPLAAARVACSARCVGGWQLSGIGTLTTGRPFTVFMQTGVNNGAPSWPNRIGSGELDHPTVDLWYNPADFVAPPANTYGNSGRGILYGRGTSTWTRRCRSGSPLVGPIERRSSGGTRSTCSTTPASASPIRTSTRRPPGASRRRSSTTARCSSR